ncbi:DNA gyrase subunit B [Pyxidicoccus sp. 3LG]
MKPWLTGGQPPRGGTQVTGTNNAADTIELVRKRPGMYVGGTDAYGLHHLVYFLLDAVFSDARRGECGDIALEVGTDGSLSLFSNCRVVPPPELAGVVQGSAFYRQPEAYAWEWGNHLPISLALASRYQVDVWEGGRQWRLLGRDGRPSAALAEVAPTEPMPVEAFRGMRIQLVPDASIFFGDFAFESERLFRRCQELAALAPGLRARFTDDRTGQHAQLHYPGGITQWLEERIQGLPRLHPEPLSFDVQWEGLRVRCALQWCEADDGDVWSYANTVRTRKNGAHVDGVFLALRNALSVLSGERVSVFSRPQLERGLMAIIAADGPEERMAFAGPTKELLAIEGLKWAVRRQLRPLLVDALRAHPLTPWLLEWGRYPRQRESP